MTTDAVELLDQHDLLQRQDGVAFVHELRRFHDFLTSGPDAITAALGELRADAQRIEREFEAHDETLLPQLVELKNELVARAPHADDSNVQRPRRVVAPPGAWSFTLANFDQVAAGGPDRNIVRQGWDTSRSGMLLRILEHKLRALQWTVRPQGPNPQVSETNLRPDLDDLARRLRNLGERHRHAAQTFTHAVDTHGGFKVLHLDIAVQEMNPAPREVETDADEHAWMDETFRRVAGGWHVIEDAAAGRALNSQAERTLDFLVERLKPAAQRVYEDVRMKLATAPPPPPPPPPGYGERVKAWMLSPGYALVGGPCVGGVITQAVEGESGQVALFAVAALVSLVVPPALHRAPTIAYTVRSVAFIVLVTASVVVALLASGLALALVLFALLVTAFLLGQRSA